ncbi:unnamed protein product, partial [Vitis vinifera]|eukprot:XP_010657248.1 PREDICTED: uncharacterized protein LOC100258502 isoform X1 [Vitis vinifera]
MQRLRISGTSLLGSFAVPHLKKKAMNSWSAVQDTYHSTKDTFERHRVVFAIGTSIASVATAWAGYSIRYLHQEKVDKRLAAIEDSMKSNYHLEHTELKKIYDSGNSRNAACIATAGVTLIIGYGLGWRGGRWYANRKFRREQMKLLGQIKPKRTPLQFLRRLRRQKAPETAPKTSPTLQKDAPYKNDSLQTRQQQLL